MKKVLLWMFVLVMSLSMVMAFSLAGCKEAVEEEAAEEEAEPAEVEEEVAEEEEEAAEEGGPVKLTIWMTQSPTRETLQEQLYAKYQAINPNVEIVTELLGGDKEFATKLNLAASGEGILPDILDFHIAFNRNLIDLGLVSPVPEWYMTPEEMEEIFFKTPIEPASKDGQYYHVPYDYNFDMGILMVNMEKIEAAGIELPEGWPESWDDIIEVAEKTTIYDDNGKMIQSGLALGERAGRVFLSGILDAGVDIFDEETNTFVLQTEEGKKSLEFMRDLVMEHNVWEFGFPGRLVAMREGSAAMILSGVWELGHIQRDYPDVYPNLKTFTLPPFFGSDPHQTVVFSGWGFGVASDSENQEEAWKYIQFMLEDTDNLNLRYEITKYLPAIKEGLNAPFYVTEEGQLHKPAHDALPYCYSLWPAKSSIGIWGATDQFVEMVQAGEMSVEAALKTMEKNMNVLMTEWYRY